MNLAFPSTVKVCLQGSRLKQFAQSSFLARLLTCKCLDSWYMDLHLALGPTNLRSSPAWLSALYCLICRISSRGLSLAQV